MTSAAAQELDTTSADTSPLDPAAPPAVAAPEDAAPPAILRGGAQGLEILVDARATIDAIIAAITERLAQAPAFFRNTDVRFRVEHGPLPPGSLARLDQLASSFDVRIVEIAAARRPGVDRRAAAPAPEATVDVIPEATVDAPAEAAVEATVDATAEAAAAPAPAPATSVETAADAPVTVAREDEPARPEGTRIVVGPVRSGVMLDHGSHIIVFGDVNPGAEIRAGGSIVVMGRLRGTAHAGIAGRGGFILALRLQPQQLRIGRIVARAGDSDTPAAHAEIAHVAEGTIIVEEYRGRLPSQLAASLQEEIHG